MKHLPSPPILPLSPHPALENFYLLLSRTLYYKLSRNLGGRVSSEEKKEEKPTSTPQPEIQSRREQSHPRSIPRELTLLGPAFPMCNSQSLTALNFKVLNHFSK